MTKFIFVTGGVLSSLGKGLASASIGALLESRGIRVDLKKFDPYLNVDPGTMSPFQHGEVFVTADGAETDLDLGHYERFTQAVMSKENNVTAGQIYWEVISKERRGDYLGGTVQVIPHVTDEIKAHFYSTKPDVDVVICEIGGTVGDIESLPFLEAMRQLRLECGRENVIFIHLTLVPFIRTADELKTKPTQHSVRELREIGIEPNIILCRTDRILPPEIKQKIALFCSVDPQAVITAKDVAVVYEVPLVFHEEGLDEIIVRMLGLETREPDLSRWAEVIDRIVHPSHSVTIGLVGKYTDLKESYKSLIEALTHGGIANDARVRLEWIDAEAVAENEPERLLANADGILIPGGFGHRGIQGKVRAVQYAREQRVPFLGICLGMQCAVIEFARNVAHLDQADSSEFNGGTPHPVIFLMEEWVNYRTHVRERRSKTSDKGGTMRLGAYPCTLEPGSKAFRAYGVREISERHRHRYEFNPHYADVLKAAGLRTSGVSPDGELVEIIELADHPWFVGVQFHPEFKSSPMHPHPLFRDFINFSLQSCRHRKPELTAAR